MAHVRRAIALLHLNQKKQAQIETVATEKESHYGFGIVYRLLAQNADVLWIS
jgi:hypothetical protein